MSELLGKAIKSVTHGFDICYGSIINIETENEIFHYKIGEFNKPLELISTTERESKNA